MKAKIIKDLTHGFIQIDKNIAKVIDHRSFQRLKNISQLTAHHLFPSANHTRFEHSLGVMHLASKFIEGLSEKLIEMDKKEEIELDKLHLKYAALLHDVGHAPMSHVGEGFYNKEKIIESLESIIGNNKGQHLKNGSSHELMSCYIIAKNFSLILEQIFVEEKINLDLDYIFRIITGSKYGSSNWNRNLIIDIVNSNSIDVDKIDYLMRDNIMVGDVAPRINLDRILFSLTIDSLRKIAYLPVGISSVVSIIDSRDFLYLWLYNHHIVVYTDFLYQAAIRHLCNEENIKSKQKIVLDDYFSCKAISEYYVTDDDIRVLLNKEFLDTDSEVSKKVLSQLLERKFLKPLWKTIFEFNTFMYDKKNFDDRQRKEIIKIFEEKTDEKIRLIVKEIVKQCSLNYGDIFIIKRSNKFYAMSNKSEFYINDSKTGDVELSKIMPERRFDENYSNVAFYVFTLPEKIDEVKIKLTEILKGQI